MKTQENYQANALACIEKRAKTTRDKDYTEIPIVHIACSDNTADRTTNLIVLTIKSTVIDWHDIYMKRSRHLKNQLDTKNCWKNNITFCFVHSCVAPSMLAKHLFMC